MSTDIDGAAAPPVTPDPDGDSVPAGPGWLQQEIRRRAARAGSSSGRHARRGVTEPPSTAHEYEPRHGDGSAPANPVVAPPPRREQLLPPPPRPWSQPPRTDPRTGEGSGGATPAPARPIPRADWRVRPAPALPSAPSPLAGSRPHADAPPALPPVGAGPLREPSSAFVSPAAAALTAPVPVVPPVAPAPKSIPPAPDTDSGAPEAAATAVVVPSPVTRSAPGQVPPTAGTPTAETRTAGTPTAETRTSETRTSETPTSETLPGLPALPSRPSVSPGPATATFAGPGAPSRPGPTPRKRPRPDPPSGAPAALLPGTEDAEPRPQPGSADPHGDLDGAEPDDLDDVDDGLLDEDLGTDGGDRILWSAGPPPAVPAPRTSDAKQEGLDGPGDLEPAGALRVSRFPRADDLGQQRVRVVLSERKGVARPVRNVVELQESGAVGDLLRSNLIGSQLGVALRFALGGGLVLGLLPLLFASFPEVGRFEVLGFRVPWILLGLLVYPFLFGLGWWFTRVAERVEQHFADQVQD